MITINKVSVLNVIYRNGECHLFDNVINRNGKYYPLLLMITIENDNIRKSICYIFDINGKCYLLDNDNFRNCISLMMVSIE